MRDHFNGEPLTGAEIGVMRGANTINIFRKLNINKMYLIDPYKIYDGIDGTQKFIMKDTERIANHKLRRYRNRITFVKELSEDATEHVPNELDFVYIDGNHHYEYIKKDIELYYPKIKKNGVIGGHDFDQPEVARAVTEFAYKRNITPITLGFPTDWWLVKTQ
jgi:hypothetical protein